MRSRSRPGFTLIETLVSLGISTLVLATAVPNFGAALNARRIDAAAGEIGAAFQLARTEAVRSNRNAVFCRSTDGQVCADGAGAWTGWIVFVDSDGDGQRGADEQLVRSGSIDSPLAAYSSASIAALDNRIAFQPDGRARGGDGIAGLNGSLALCLRTPLGTDHVRRLDIAFGGRARIARTSAAGPCVAPSDA